MMSATVIAVAAAALAIVALAALGIALASWRRARLAADRAAALADALAVALEGALDAETRQERLETATAALRGRLDRMVLKQGRLHQPQAEDGYRAAIDLTREGADDEVTMTTCGLSRGEARLIRNLYRGQAH